VPVYEYRCGSCGKAFNVLVPQTEDADSQPCKFCGSTEVSRQVSRFRRGTSEEDRFDKITDRLERVGEPESASELREMARDAGAAADEDLADEFEEMFEADMDEDTNR
jgi:putative FmdB family regulatory protein